MTFAPITVKFTADARAFNEAMARVTEAMHQFGIRAAAAAREHRAFHDRIHKARRRDEERYWRAQGRVVPARSPYRHRRRGRA